MEGNEAAGFHHNLTNKELQDLCMKHGLSPQRAVKWNLTKSLSLISPVKSSRAHCTFLIPRNHSEALPNDSVDIGKGNGNIITFNREEHHSIGIHSQAVKSSLPGCCNGGKSSNQASNVEILKECMHTITNIRRSSRIASKKRHTSYKQEKKCRKLHGGGIQHPNVNNGALSLSSSMLVPSFEFKVRSEEGIRLFVDLNSSSSEWAKSLENEVCICQNMQKNKFQSFRQELEYIGNSNKQLSSSVLWNIGSDSGKNSNPDQINSSLRTMEGGTGPVRLDQTYTNGDSLTVPMTKPCAGIGEVSQLEAEKQVPSIVRLNFDASDSVVSETKSGLRYLERKSNDSNASSGLKLCWNSIINSTPNSLESLSSVKDQSLRFGNENCGNICLSKSCPPGNFTATYPMEMQFSEVATHGKEKPCSAPKNDSFLDLFDEDHNSETGDDGLANTRDLNPEGLWKYIPPCAEDQERGNLIDGAEASDQQVSCTLDKMSEVLVSDGGYDNIRSGSESASDCGRLKGRILRSMRDLCGSVLPRRSMRLVSKMDCAVLCCKCLSLPPKVAGNCRRLLDSWGCIPTQKAINLKITLLVA